LALNHIAGSNVSLTDLFGSFLRISSSVLEGAVIAVISGIYLAAQPRLYLDGLIQLLPPEAHVRAAERIEAIGNALRLWLIGQLIRMVIIGALAMIALLLIGVPSALALGLIAAVGEFVPYVGPIVAAIPAILIAMSVGPTAALWTVGAYIAINQIEGHLVIPLIQRHFVFIPPAVILLGIVAVTELFGPASFVFAAPLSVVIFIAIKVFYVRDTIGEETRVRGESC
jgi:predicted PurR-regulated permease PerM